MKRLWISCLLILLLIPILVFGYCNIAREESGIMTIALAQMDDNAMASGVIADLVEEDSLILFLKCETPEAAEEMVAQGKADAAWIFPADMEQKVYEFAAAGLIKKPFIQVIEGESTELLGIMEADLIDKLHVFPRSPALIPPRTVGIPVQAEGIKGLLSQRQQLGKFLDLLLHV